MASFKTTDPDREWKVRLTVGLCEELKAAEGLDIGGVIKDAEKFVAVLFAEPDRLVRVLWECCKGQAAAYGVTPEQFGGLFDGDVLESGVEALLDAAVGFIPKSQGREGIKAGLPKVLAKMATEANAEIGRRIEKVLSMSFEPAGSTPGSSGSTPAT